MRLDNGSKIGFGDGVSTIQFGERRYGPFMNFIVKMDINRENRKARRCYKKEHAGSVRDFDKFPAQLKQMIEDEYDIIPGYLDSHICPIITSATRNPNKKKKIYNAASYMSGETTITYSYYQLFDSSPSAMDKRAVVRTYMHECGHHDFRLNTMTLNVCGRMRRFISYVDECYADVRAYKVLKQDANEAADEFWYDAMRYFIDRKKPDKYGSTHPSLNFRTLIIRKGKFNRDTIREIAEYINKNKKFNKITESDIRFVIEKIEEFEKNHPDIQVFYE